MLAAVSQSPPAFCTGLASRLTVGSGLWTALLREQDNFRGLGESLEQQHMHIGFLPGVGVLHVYVFV